MVAGEWALAHGAGRWSLEPGRWSLELAHGAPGAGR